VRVVTGDPLNVGAALGKLSGESLGQDEMYVRSNLPLPSSLPRGFDLVIPGRADRFVGLADLASFETVEQSLVLECAGNGRTLMTPTPAGTPWDLDAASPITVAGYRLAEVLGDLPGDVIDVVFTGADVGEVEPEGRIRYQFSISRDMALSPRPLLVTHIGGEPLSMAHGAPLRLIVPGHYAMKSVKWLVRVEGTTVPFEGHFVKKYRYYRDDREPEGSPVGDLAVRSIIATPGDGDTLPAGRLEILGSAWSGASEIASVDVSVDGAASWHQAQLVRLPGGPWAPVRWSFVNEPEAGQLEILARATDSSGATQPLEPRWNANGYANNVVHRIRVSVE
jgi:DMSO/TMAO reductase YedYZ molybdopterin-dependent catalytic subunit